MAMTMLKKTCRTCGGVGEITQVDCKRCLGEGVLFKTSSTSTYIITPEGKDITCPYCEGTGKVESEPHMCLTCFGDGYTSFTKEERS